MLSLMRISFLPYNTRERLRRRAVAKLLYARPSEGEAGAAGAIAHIEDSPCNLPLLVLSSTRKQSGRLQDRLVDLPDWARDQALAVDDLIGAAGGERGRILLDRARAALLYLDELEERLPPIERPDDRRWLDMRLVYLGLLGRSILPVRPLVLDSWFERVTRSAAVGTTFGALSQDDARNLLLHGYYLACCNLHIVLGWPLLARLDASSLDELCGESVGRSVKAAGAA
jgi:hypothetical protein